jgi:hypothetical protein
LLSRKKRIADDVEVALAVQSIYRPCMKTLRTLTVLTAVSATVVLASIAVAGSSPERPAREQKKNEQEKLVFVTGSNIPQRIKVKAIGTETVSPLRVYKRDEIDRMGRFTTEGIVAQDPSLRVVGGGAPGTP